MPLEKECAQEGEFVRTQAHAYNHRRLVSAAKQATTWVSSFPSDQLPKQAAFTETVSPRSAKGRDWEEGKSLFSGPHLLLSPYPKGMPG